MGTGREKGSFGVMFGVFVWAFKGNWGGGLCCFCFFLDGFVVCEFFFEGFLLNK